jgi:hypothetical protein
MATEGMQEKFLEMFCQASAQDGMNMANEVVGVFSISLLN